MPRNANGSVYALGHWETMQIAIALNDLRNSLKAKVCQGCENGDGCYSDSDTYCASDDILATARLAGIFSQTHSLVSIITTETE